MSTQNHSHNKSRILFLLSYLYEHTDEAHMVSTNEVMQILLDAGFKANRKTVKDDMETLISAGFDVVSFSSTATYYFMGTRVLELPELKLLIDAVSSSRFISQKKSEALIRKLSALAGEHQAPNLTAHIYTANRVKAENSALYYIVDTISEAIDKGKQIRFQYFEYSATMKKVLRNGGEVYINSPYALLWNEDYYYLLGYSEKHDGLVTFRVDRMTQIEILDADCIPHDDTFNAVEYAQKNFKMYEGENEQTVVLECENRLMNYIVDRFGENVLSWKSTDETFRAKVSVNPAGPFYGWVFQFCGAMTIVEPKEVAEEFRSIAYNFITKK